MIIRCPKCNKFFDYDIKIKKFEGFEKEFLQDICTKIDAKIKKLQYKHDYIDMPAWKLRHVNNQIYALDRIKNILQDYI